MGKRAVCPIAKTIGLPYRGDERFALSGNDRFALPLRLRYTLLMFENFTATDRWTKKPAHCVYQAQIVAIATRHADAVDYKFLVDGRKVWVALPHPAWVEYKKRTGTLITDSLGVEIAGHYLKTALESGEGLGREMFSLTVEETLKHLEAAVAEMQAQPA
jgi:hypothetical protein